MRVGGATSHGATRILRGIMRALAQVGPRDADHPFRRGNNSYFGEAVADH